MTQLCRDPECVDPMTGQRSLAEPEQDGDLRFYACPTCGYETGYTRVTPTGDEAKSTQGCPVGIPEDVRRRASAPISTLPLLQIGRRT